MADVKTTETKKVAVEVEVDWGTFKRNHSSPKRPDILKIKFAFDAIKNKFGNIIFTTKRTGGWFGLTNGNGMTSVQRLRALRDALTEVIEEVDKLSE